jgi:hypothetical protein
MCPLGGTILGWPSVKSKITLKNEEKYLSKQKKTPH